MIVSCPYSATTSANLHPNEFSRFQNTVVTNMVTDELRDGRTDERMIGERNGSGSQSGLPKAKQTSVNPLELEAIIVPH